jgi:16S rRNA (cytidine1402-2'-O)-methyltransferase
LIIEVPIESSPSSLLLRAAAQAAGGQQYPSGCLYVVATPIGNMADLSLRALHVLGLVDAVGCEDTRVTAGLMQRLGLHKELLAVHEHNEARAAEQVVARLQGGQRIAYVSDAGTPAISDPGARLVAAVQAAGLRVMPLPGASSVATALCVAGDTEGQGFRFAGFAPPKPKARASWLEMELADGRTTVLFEAPHRIEALLQALAEAAPQRRLTLCRELTKQFEQIVTLTCADAPGWLQADAQHQKGEFVLVLHAVPAAAPAEGLDAVAERLLKALLKLLRLKQAVAVAAEASGTARNLLYAQALAWRGDAVQDELEE